MPDGQFLIYKKFGFSDEVALVDDDDFIWVGPQDKKGYKALQNQLHLH